MPTASPILDRAVSEAALMQPPPIDPIGQRRLRWMSSLERRFLQSQIHRQPEAVAHSFLMAYYGRLRLSAPIRELLGDEPALRLRPSDVAPLAEAMEPTVALPRVFATRP